MSTPERCLCGDPACPTCGPAQGYVIRTPAEEAEINRIAGELLAERMHFDGALFADLMSGIEPTSYYPLMQQFLQYVDRACYGDWEAMNGLIRAASNLQRLIKPEAERIWTESLREKAAEIFDEESV